MTHASEKQRIDWKLEQMSHIQLEDLVRVIITSLYGDDLDPAAEFDSDTFDAITAVLDSHDLVPI